MPTDAQVEKARSIFKAAKQNNSIQRPESTTVPPPGDKSSASKLLADLIARDQDTLKNANALPKYPREKHEYQSDAEIHPPEKSAPATPQTETQGQTGHVSQPLLSSGESQEIYRVAAGTLAKTLDSMQLVTKPKTGPQRTTLTTMRSIPTKKSQR